MKGAYAEHMVNRLKPFMTITTNKGKPSLPVPNLKAHLVDGVSATHNNRDEAVAGNVSSHPQQLPELLLP